MNQMFILLVTALIIGSFALISRGYRKSGSALFAKAIFLVLAVLPSHPINALASKNKKFRHWVVPRKEILRRDWYVFAGCFSVGVGLCMAFRKPVQSRKPGWDEPDEQQGLDQALADRLDSSERSTETLVGMAVGGRQVCLGPTQRERHMQVVGPTRSGKSQLLFALTAQDMRAGMPVFFMEAKGDRGDFDQFLTLAERAGRRSAVRYFNPADPRSHTFNPIRRMRGQDATSLANQISRVVGREPTNSNKTQEYHLVVDYAKIQNMAEIFWETKLQYTLRDCFYYFNYPQCREAAYRLCNDARLVEMTRREFEQKPDTTGLTSSLRPYTTGPLGELLNTYAPQIKLEDIFAKNQLAYFAIPIGHLPVLANPLGRMLISGLNSAASWRQFEKKKPGPASVILDEFAEFATPAFKNLIQTVGSAHFWTTLSHQDLGQLRNIEGMDKEAFDSVVFNNSSGCKICFRSPDPEDAEFWSSMMGTYQTYEDTEQYSKSMLGARATGMMSRRKVEHFKVHPNTLKNLKPGSALVFAPGHEDSLVRTTRVFKITEGDVPRLLGVNADEEPGLDLASVMNPGRRKAAIDEKGVKV